MWESDILEHKDGIIKYRIRRFEKELTEKFPPSKKYSYEERGSSTVRVYSYDFSKAYHNALDGMVEKRMRAAIKMVGDFWFTCWVNAGQPDLSLLKTQEEIEEEKLQVNDQIKVRNHESGEAGQP